MSSPHPIDGPTAIFRSLRPMRTNSSGSISITPPPAVREPLHASVARMRCERVWGELHLPRPRTKRLTQSLHGPNHQRRRTVFKTHNGRSVLEAGTGLHAPHLPFAIPAGIGSVGWIVLKNSAGEAGQVVQPI